MAIPNPPVTPNTSKLHYLLYDNSGSNAAAVWHSIKEITVNGEVVGVAHVGTHRGGDSFAWTAGDPCVLVAGTNGTDVLPLRVDPNGDVGELWVNANISVVLVPEDSASTTGDTLLAIAAVRQDTIASNTSTDGDYTWLKVDSVGRLYVNVNDGGNTITVDGTVAVSSVGSTVTVDTELETEDLDTGAGSDVHAVIGLVYAASGGALPVSMAQGLPIQPGTSTVFPVSDNSGSITVDAPAGTPVNVQVGDGSNTATIRNLASNDALNVAIVDGSGAHITSFGGGTQYQEGDTDADVVGTALMWEDTSDTLRAVSAAKPLPVNIVAGGGSGGTSHVDDNAFAGPGSGSGTPMMGYVTTDSADSGDVGVVGMTAARAIFTNVRDDAGDSCMDGSNNALRVSIVSGAGSGGTAITDEAAYTEASSSFTPIGGVFNDSLASDPSAGQGAAVRITSDRAFHVNLRGSTGTELGTSGAPVRTDPTGTTTQPVSGTVAVSGSVTVDSELPAAVALSSDNVSNPTAPAVGAFGLYFDGSTWDRIRGDSTDGLLVNLGANNDVSATVSGPTAHDSPVTGSPVLMAGTSSAAAPTSVSADGDVVRAWYLRNGAAAVQLTASGTLITGDSSGLDVDTELPAAAALADAEASATAVPSVGTRLMGFNGTTWDRIRTANTGRLQVDIVSGAGSGGTASADDSAFTIGSSNGTPMMGLFDDTSTDSVDENDVGVLRMTADRKLLTRVVGATDTNRLDVDSSGRVTAQMTASGTALVAGNGTNGSALRVTLASDSSGVITTNAGTGAFACNLGIDTTGVDVSTTATLLGGLASRRRVVVQNRDTSTSLYVGASDVTASGATGGIEIFPQYSMPFEIGPGIALYGITASGTVNVRVLELA